MSPALVMKYLQAAHTVSEHLVLQSDGFMFSPHPVVADTDRDKWAVFRIVEFYRRQPTEYADYFMAAWRFQHRAALERPAASLGQVAAELRISIKYLALIWSTLTDSKSGTRPGSDAGRGEKGGFSLPPALITRSSSATSQMAARQHGKDSGSELLVPADPAERKRYEAAFARFAEVFPNAFYITERARVYLDAEKEQENEGRLLSAGLHSMTGYFRDDQPLYALILDEPAQQELDRLWQDFELVASVPQRMHTSFVWFERTDSAFMRDPEFDAYRPEDKSVTRPEKIRSLAELYLAKIRRARRFSAPFRNTSTRRISHERTRGREARGSPADRSDESGSAGQRSRPTADHDAASR